MVYSVSAVGSRELAWSRNVHKPNAKAAWNTRRLSHRAHVRRSLSVDLFISRNALRLAFDTTACHDTQKGEVAGRADFNAWLLIPRHKPPWRCTGSGSDRVPVRLVRSHPTRAARSSPNSIGRMPAASPMLS